MPHFSLRTWISNAAAVFSGQYGAVTEQAQHADCSRQTVYQHARKLEHRLTEPADSDRLHTEIAQLKQQIARLKRDAQGQVSCTDETLREVATTAAAMGLSYRQIEELLGVFLPPEKSPDHSTIARWVSAQAKRAGEVLKVLDPHCAATVETLAIDEIFFGGDRPSLASNRQAWRPCSAKRRRIARRRAGRNR